MNVICPPVEVGTRPFYDELTNKLYFVDVPESTIYKYDLTTKTLNKARVGEDPLGFAFPVENSSTKFIAGVALKIIIFEWDGQSSQVETSKVLAEVPGPGRFNGGKIDAFGRLWAGTMGPKDQFGNITPGLGSLYSLTRGVLQTHETSVGISNGIAWNHNKMFYVDTLQPKVFQYDFDYDKGEISNKKIVFDFTKSGVKGLPDGLTIDSEGCLWVAAIHGGQIVRFNPENGEILQQLSLGTPQVTACTFGGINKNVLFVTTARSVVEGLTLPEPAGSTFAIPTQSQGFFDVRYKL